MIESLIKLSFKKLFFFNLHFLKIERDFYFLSTHDKKQLDIYFSKVLVKGWKDFDSVKQIMLIQHNYHKMKVVFYCV